MNLKSFTEFNCDVFLPNLGSFGSLKGRFICFKMLLQKMILLPFVMFFKALVTLFRVVAFLMGTIGYIVSLGSSHTAQEVLSNRAAALAKDLIDWITFPLVVGIGFFKLFLGAALTPAVYFQ